MAQRFYDPANGFSLYTGAAPTWREAQDPAGYVRGPDGSWGNYDYFTGQFTPVDPMANVQGAPAGWYGANDARLFTDSEVFQPQKATYAGDLTNTNAMLGSLKTQYGLDNVDLKSALDAYFSKTGGNINDVNWWGDTAATLAYLQGLGMVDPAKFGGLWGQYAAAHPDWQQTIAQQGNVAAQNGMAMQAKQGADSGMPWWAGVALAAIGGGFAAALGGAAAPAAAEGVSLGAADVFTGGVINSSGEIAGLSTLGNTGGALVGTQGIISGTGNAVVDAALNKGLQGAITSAVTGQDPLKGGLAGVLSGGFASVIPDMGSAILNNAASGAIGGGISAAVNGGDAVTGALAGGAAAGAGTAVKDILPASSVGSTVSNAVAGGVAGGVGSAIAGGDVTTGILKGATSGGVAGAATDLGASPGVAGAVGSVAAGLIDTPTSGGTTVTPAQQTSSTLSGGLGFDIVLPQFQGVSRRDMQWGTRLSGGQQ